MIIWSTEMPAALYSGLSANKQTMRALMVKIFSNEAYFLIALIVFGIAEYGVFFLNMKIYNKKWFLVFVPVSVVVVLIGFLLKQRVEFEVYKYLIVLPVQVYLIKITQLLFGLFNQTYIVNIRGCDFGEPDRDLHGFPSMDSLFSIGIILIVLTLFIII